VDEAAHIDPALFFKTIVPILQMTRTSLIMLSSPTQDGDYFSQLLQLKRPGGEPFFNVIDCFQICTRCMKLERTKAMLCKHVKSTAHWLSTAKTRELKLLYTASPEDALRELGGIVVSDGKPALPKPEIERCFATAPIMTHNAPPFVFTACDPNGGGPSHMSICSAYFGMGGELVIVGLDSEAVRDDREEYLLLARHYQRLLDSRHFRASRLVFIPENNLALESAHLDTMVKDIPGVTTYWEKPTRPGVCKDGKATRGYQFELSNALCHNSIRFDHDLFTVTREQTPQTMRNLLQEQMLRYSWVRKPAADAMLGKDRYALTGKVGSKQDDLLIATMMVSTVQFSLLSAFLNFLLPNRVPLLGPSSGYGSIRVGRSLANT